MKKLSNPRDLLVAQLSELLWVERRLAFDVLPHLIEAAHDDGLAALFREHHEQTQQHVERVERTFRELGMEPSSAISPGMDALIGQHDELTAKIVEPHLEDAWHVAAAIASEHFELALYGGIDRLAPDAVRKLLAQNVKDEKAALDRLVKIAVLPS